MGRERERKIWRKKDREIRREIERKNEGGSIFWKGEMGSYCRKVINSGLRRNSLVGVCL